MATKKTTKLVVKKDPDSDVTAEVLAESIVKISQAMRQLRSGRLKDRAIIILLASSTGLNQHIIKQVIEGISSLEATYLK